MLISLLGSPFSRNIRYLRKKRKISQKEMARRMDMSLYYYRKRFEQKTSLDSAVFDIEELHNLCQIFMKTPFELIELDMEEMGEIQDIHLERNIYPAPFWERPGYSEDEALSMYFPKKEDSPSK